MVVSGFPEVGGDEGGCVSARENDPREGRGMAKIGMFHFKLILFLCGLQMFSMTMLCLISPLPGNNSDF